MPSGFRDIGIRKLGFVAKTQFLCLNSKNLFILFVLSYQFHRKKSLLVKKEKNVKREVKRFVWNRKHVGSKENVLRMNSSWKFSKELKLNTERNLKSERKNYRKEPLEIIFIFSMLYLYVVREQ